MTQLSPTFVMQPDRQYVFFFLPLSHLLNSFFIPSIWGHLIIDCRSNKFYPSTYAKYLGGVAFAPASFYSKQIAFAPCVRPWRINRCIYIPGKLKCRSICAKIFPPNFGDKSMFHLDLRACVVRKTFCRNPKVQIYIDLSIFWNR